MIRCNKCKIFSIDKTLVDIEDNISIPCDGYCDVKKRWISDSSKIHSCAKFRKLRE